MSKEITNAYDKIMQEWMHRYEGVETPEIVALEEQMDNLWKRMSLEEHQEYLLENGKQLESAAADFILIYDGVKNHE